MKKHRFLCFTLSLLMLLLLPLTGLYNSENAVVYAVDTILDDTATKYLIPVLSYLMINYERSLQGLQEIIPTKEEIQSKVNELMQYEGLLSSLPAQVKAKVASMLTDLSHDTINSAYGTNLTLEKYMEYKTTWSQRLLDNYYQTRPYELMYDTGIAHLFSSSIKSKSNVLNDKLNDQIMPEYGYRLHTIGDKIFAVEDKAINYDFWSSLGVPVYINNKISQYGTLTRLSFSTKSEIVIGNYKLVFGSSDNVQTTNLRYYPVNNSNFTPSDIVKNDDMLSFATTSYNCSIYLFVWTGAIWSEQDYISNSITNKNLMTYPLKILIDEMKAHFNIDLTNTNYYSDDYVIGDVVNLIYNGSTAILPTGSISSSFSLPAVGTGFFTGEDVSKSDAERLVDALGTSTATLDVNIGTNTKANDDPDTNVDFPVVTDVVLSPTTEVTVPGVDTSNPDGSIPGEENPPVTDIPILGDLWSLLKAILDWLKGLLDALKTLLLSLFIPSPTFFTNYFNNLKNFVGARLGLLDYPIELLILFANSYLSIPDTGNIVINVPELKVNLLGITYSFFPAYTFDFNTIFGISSFATLRNAYLVAVDVIVVLGLVYLLNKKASEVFRS